MSVDNTPGGADKLTGALLRAEIVSRALTAAARRSRFSKRTRRRMGSSGFAARKGEAFFRLFFAVSFVVIVLVPSLLGLVYYTLIASDQYVAEARFTLRGGEALPIDADGILSSLPSLTVVQDTQIVADYIQSRAIVQRLEQTVNLRSLYSYVDIDRFERFDPSKPIEKLISYWRGKVDVSISPTTGIVLVTVRAFRAKDAAIILDSVLALSEALINDMNERMRRDHIQSSEQEHASAMKRLTAARVALELARNTEGILDADEAAKAMNKLITTVETDRIALQQEYDTQRRSIAEQAPQMRALKARIDAANVQITQLRAKMTSQNNNSADKALSESYVKFSELGLDYQIAEKRYAAAVATLELARVSNERKQLYLNTFVRPMTPQEPRYPRRGLYPFFVLCVVLVLWGSLCGSVVAIRAYMA